MNRRSFLKTSALAAATTAFSGMLPTTNAAPEKTRRPAASNKRDLVMRMLDANVSHSYIPAGFFMHFPRNQRSGDAAIRAHADYFRATGMDFVKIQFEQSYPKCPDIKKPSDWRNIPVLDESFFEPTLHVIRGLMSELKSEALILPTIYGPYQMAKQAVHWKTLVAHANEDPEAVKRGMENVYLSVMKFVNAAVRLGVDGFYTCTQGGESNRLAARPVFENVVKTYDLLMMKQVAAATPFNILHICDHDGPYDTGDFAARFADYPGHIVNIPNEADGKHLSLSQAAALFQRPVMGGLDRKGVLATGTPAQIRATVRDLLRDAPDRVILAADCTVAPTTPIENLRAAIETAHTFRS
ncbi:uroporphyrinogen decarboxylase family protein [Ereboglobus luteus]|nr:uroporphyrinogen decarboxylase family protein [Ereboglobus luteus]